MNPTRDRKLMEKRSESLPPNFESLVDKNGQTVYKGFVFLPGTISDNIQQLKLHLPTGHLYCVKNDHCSTNGCPGMFNRRSHNAHPIYSRAKMHVEAFRWQVGLFLLHEGGRVTPKKAIEICFQDWPLELGINIVQLYDSLKTSLYTFQRASKEENGQSTFMKKSFLQEYPQKKLDRFIAALKLNIHYWGPYTGPKPAVEKEKSVPTGKRRRENVSPQRSSGSVEKEMNPQKKARQETDKDPKGVKISRSSGNAKEKIGEKISSSNKSKDKASPRVPVEENKSHRKDKRSREESKKKKKRNSDSESDRARNSFETSTPKEKESSGSDGESGNFSSKENSIPSSAELTPNSVLGVSRESVESADLTEVKRMLEEVRMEAERKSREAEHLKKALAHLLSYRSVESDGSKLSQEKIDEIIQLDGKTSGELLKNSCPDQPKESEKELQAASVSLSDSSCSLDRTVSTNRQNLGNSFRNGRPWGPLSRRRLLPEEKSFDELERAPDKEIRFPETLMKRSTKILNQNGMDVFAVPLKRKSIESSSNFERFVFGKAHDKKEHRTVLVLGANGSERRKFIDGIINYIFKVNKEDKFRLQLIQEDDAVKTNCIKVYDIHHCEGFPIPFSLTIVDTPNFDSNQEELEIFRDKETIEIFHEFFENKESVEELDMICNVGTEISSSFLSVFANDLKENIHCFQPSDYVSDTWHDDVQTFFTLLATMKKKSLSLTKKLLSGRKRLESTVYEIRSLINNGLAMTEEMVTAKQMESNCQMRKQQIMKNCQTEVKQEVVQVELPAGQFANNCSHCNVTCSSSVFMDKNGRTGYYWPLIDLSMSTEAGTCTVCPEKCNWNVHSIKPYRLECVQLKTELPSGDQNSEVECKWETVYSTVLDMVNFLEDKISVNSKSILHRFQMVESCIWSLDKISGGKLLLTRKLVSFLLADAESQLNRLGLKEKIQSLKTLFN
ncbi:uncharacterized protein LOC124208464 isoform X3 [Daphnia pulex]|uniref:uncharacterized protein LOC124208464 isoform X3 n=1 Tax=Daphnia pulex TaxID=6669 RepID=UPI001EDEE502|nr:uncharacterized protein LOC124208464 isoform X3 [Daphnia pulex]